MGPMRAAASFTAQLRDNGLLSRTDAIVTRLYGSLALTGAGHGTDRAILLGLEGADPETIDPDSCDAQLARIRSSARLRLPDGHEIAFDEPMQLLFLRQERLDFHTNGMRFTAFGGATPLLQEEYFSVGGGFVVRGGQGDKAATAGRGPAPYPFETAAQLLEHCRDKGLEMHQLVLANELAWGSLEQIDSRLDTLWATMRSCVERGFRQQGILPGGLKVRRRAPRLHRQLLESADSRAIEVMDWVNAWALAVNEENAAGGRVVTAPTNGAAGIVPAVLHYYSRFEPGASVAGVRRFLLVAGAIGMLYKSRASLSGAEMGCQGEVGVACSMAAGGLVAALNGTNEQIENAAEIGMEHNLGLTCDPVGGLVQIPCIERNAMGSVKAINAARLALRGDGSHKVTLDQVIATMRQTGEDMLTRYKETSQGGLAVNVPEC
jgi:L-serine dehydratase